MAKKMFKRNKIIFSILIILCFSLISINNISISYAQSNGELFSFSSDFGFIEYCQIKGGKENVSSIDIDLPEPNWTISNIQINFSHISLGSEIRVIEDTETTLEQVWNKNSQFRTFALATQIEILEDTDLIGVFIKGYKSPEANETIKFQIQGFDETNFIPNGIIYRSNDLNISTNLDWYYQDFSSNPINLPIGNYSLVMNGTSLPLSDKAKYFWQKDDLDPDISFLYTSSYITSWTPDTVNSSFLCKLKVSDPDQLYFPSELNMTAQINGDNYEIINGLTKGKGFLNLSNFGQVFNESDLNIPILINQSLILKYNYNYSINLINEFSTQGSAIVGENSNRWILFPLIDRVSNNYEVRFIFPRSWLNLTLFRKLGLSWENVTSSANLNKSTSTLTIPNGIISEGDEWKITANSPNTVLDLNLPVTDWRPSQELQFSVVTPIAGGNLTFFFINPLGFGYDEPIEVKEVLSEETLFSYIIPSNSREGSYKIIIYWNNNTDAGVQYQEFQVTIPPVPFTIDPIWIVIGIIIAIGATTAGVISYRTLKNYRIRRLEESQKLFDKCMDVMNLDYIIISDKKSGLNVYHQKFSDKEIDPAMISGFLQAIHSFGIELIKIENSSQTIKLEYRDSIIIMTEFVNLRLILLMKEPPSSNFFYSLEDLAYDIYKYYGDHIDEFNGDISPFKSIENILKQHLNTTITYPMKLKIIDDSIEKVKISPNERIFINKAKSFMKTNNKDQFYLKTLLPEKECNPKDLETILKMIDKRVIQIIE